MNKTSFALKVAIPLAILSLQTQALQAADNVELTDSGLELTVTANRRPEQVSKALAPTTVITKEDIERTQATSVAEVLASIPGVNISNSGGIGKATSVFLRGTDSDHTLLLIDGVRHGSATLGSPSFSFLPLEQIERIEVIRGPRSSLYGSEAIGGVIQVFTKKGVKGFSPSIKLSAGSNDTYQGTVNFSGGDDKTTYNLTVESLETKGIDSRGPFYDFGSGTTINETDRDGYRRKSISLNVGHVFSDKVKGDVSVLRAEGDTEFDGGFQNESDFVDQAINANLSVDVNDALNLRFSVGQSRDERDSFKDGVFSSTFNTKRDAVSAIADYSVNDNNNLLFGVDWNDAKVSSTTTYDLTSRSNTGIFGSYSAQYNNTQLDASLRYDDNEQFGSASTGGIALGQRINDGLRLKASFGTAFKAPSFNSLYFPGFGTPTLQPEESKNYEIGADGRLGNGKWEVNLFQNDIDNLITGTTSASAADSRIRGIEANFNVDIAGYNLATNITAQKPENLNGTNEGKLLRNRPERILNVNLDRKFGSVSIGSTLHAESERFSDGANTTKLAGFATLDLRADYAVSKNWSVGVKVVNVLDKEYSTSGGYNQDGINGLLSVRYAPK